MTESTQEQDIPRPASAFEQRLRGWIESSDRRFEANAAASGDVLELSMLDIVGEDWWTGGGITSKKVQEKLNAFPKAKTIKVLINSPGGDAFEGLAIQSLLRRHGGRVEVEVVGLAASAASIIAMAGDTISMHEGSLMMVHEPWTFAVGNAAEMRTAAEFLDKVNASGLDVYTRRTGRQRTDVAELVAAETWMTAHEAVDQKFATSVIEGAAPESAPAPKARAAAQAFMSARPVASTPRTPPKSSPAPIPKQEALPFAAPPAPEPIPAPPERNHMTDKPNTSDATPSVARALGLPAGATETDIVAACTRLRELELQILGLTGSQMSSEALGALKAIKQSADSAEKLQAENLTLKAERDQQAFDALVMQGQSTPVKLSPKSAQDWRGWFDKAKEQGRGIELVEQLRGFLANASPIVAAPKQPPSASGTGGSAATWNGKTYAQLKYAQRAELKKENPDLHVLMKRDWEEAGSPAATA